MLKKCKFSNQERNLLSWEVDHLFRVLATVTVVKYLKSKFKKLEKLKHHKFFQLHYPTNRDYSKVELEDIIIEDFYLYSDGAMTPNYKPEKPRTNFLNITLYPSTIYLSRKYFNKENDQTEFINKNLDAEFIRVCLRISPIQRILQFIEYHFQKCSDPDEFILHIKYIILPRIKKFSKKDKEELIDYESVISVFQEWIEKKKKTVESQKYQTNIGTAKKIIINNESIVNEQFSNKKKIGISKKKKNIIAIISLIVSLIMLLIAYITNSDVINGYMGL